MTVDEKYNERIRLCRMLKTIEDEIENLKNIHNKYNQSNGNKNATLSLYIDGKNVQYELDEKVTGECLVLISNNFLERKGDVIRAIEQALK